MTETDRRAEEDEIPRIHADIQLRRTIASLPESTMRAWGNLKRLAFLAALAGLFYICLVPEARVEMTGRLIVVLVVAWMLWDQVFARRRIGTSHILVTTKGVLLTEDNVYVRWEEMESFQHAGDLLRFKLRPDAGPRGLFAPRSFDIPLTANNREFLLELFRERVERWKP